MNNLEQMYVVGVPVGVGGPYAVGRPLVSLWQGGEDPCMIWGGSLVFTLKSFFGFVFVFIDLKFNFCAFDKFNLKYHCKSHLHSSFLFENLCHFHITVISNIYGKIIIFSFDKF